MIVMPGTLKSDMPQSLSLGIKMPRTETRRVSHIHCGLLMIYIYIYISFSVLKWAADHETAIS